MIGWRGNTNAEPDDDADDDPIVMRAQSGQSSKGMEACKLTVKLVNIARTAIRLIR